MSRASQVPLEVARSTAAMPAGAISPAAVSPAMRALLDADHALRGLRGAKYSLVRCSSTLPRRLSTQPKQSASSTDAS